MGSLALLWINTNHIISIFLNCDRNFGPLNCIYFLLCPITFSLLHIFLSGSFLKRGHKPLFVELLVLSYIVFLTLLNYLSVFYCSSLGIFGTIILNSIVVICYSFISFWLVTGSLLCTFGEVMFPCFFLIPIALCRCLHICRCHHLFHTLWSDFHNLHLWVGASWSVLWPWSTGAVHQVSEECGTSGTAGVGEGHYDSGSSHCDPQH